MNNVKAYHTWVETAYQLFAERGPEGFTVKDLAETSKLPRTNFYYYFNDREEVIQKAIDMHFEFITGAFNEELEKRMDKLIPDLYVIMTDFELGIRFAKRLFINREDPFYDKAYLRALDISAELVHPKVKEYFKIELNEEDMKRLWYTLTDVWFSRLSFANFTAEALSKLAEETWATIEPIRHSKKMEIL